MWLKKLFSLARLWKVSIKRLAGVESIHSAASKSCEFSTFPNMEKVLIASSCSERPKCRPCVLSQHADVLLPVSESRWKSDDHRLARDWGMTRPSQAGTGPCLFSPEDDLVGLTKSNKWHVAKSSSHSHTHEEVLTQRVWLQTSALRATHIYNWNRGALWARCCRSSANRETRVCVFVCLIPRSE